MRGGIIARLLLCSTVLFAAGPVEESRAQTCKKEIPETLAGMIEELSESDERVTEEYLEEIIDFFRRALEYPLNINQAEIKDLDKFFFLSDFQKGAIIGYRQEYGEFVSLNELFNIPGITKREAELLTPFICVSGGSRAYRLRLSSILKEARLQVLSRVKYIPERQFGFTPVSRDDYRKNPDCRYAGPPGYLYGQLKYELGDILKISITSEKDPGEKGPDYLSASISLHTAGIVEKLVAGSYSARFGQGLVLWNSFPGAFDTNPSSLCKKESALVPYNSTGENDSFSGAAVNLRFKRTDLSLMVSHRGYDARITGEGFTSLLTTGLHNTSTAISRRKNLFATVAGYNVSFKGSGFTVSQTSVIYSYDRPYAGRDSLKIARLGKPGAWGGNAGLSWYKVFPKNRVFGEIAIDNGASAAFIAGVVSSHGSATESCILLSRISSGYLAPYSGSMPGNSSLNEGTGLIMSLSCFSGKYSKTSLYAALQTGHIKSRLTFEYKPDKGVSHLLRLDWGESAYGMRYSITVPVTRSLSFNGREEVRFTRGEKSITGYLVSGEILFRSVSGKISSSLRTAYYNVPVWDVRIYAYERDLLYAFSVPVCYGKALRVCMNLHLSLFRSCDLWFKAAQTRYFDRSSVGEGNDLTEGPSKSELKLQIRFRL